MLLLSKIRLNNIIMAEINKKIQATSNVFRAKTLRVIYFENSILGRTLGLLWMTYSNPSDKIETLSLIRWKNSGQHI